MRSLAGRGKSPEMFADLSHKRGDTFRKLAIVPPELADGYFIGWTVAAQLRAVRGELIDDLTVEWLEPAATTRCLAITATDTSLWPLGVHEFDVQFIRTSDGFKVSSRTVRLEVQKEVTLP